MSHNTGYVKLGPAGGPERSLLSIPVHTILLLLGASRREASNLGSLASTPWLAVQPDRNAASRSKREDRPFGITSCGVPAADR